MVLFQQLCRFRLCDVLFAQKSSPKSLCKCDKLALLLAQLDALASSQECGKHLAEALQGLQSGGP